ncbi:MBOAT family protein [Oculatella sp. LEGE 06141]|uniref:MBOAT family O-acyltransferase n=1 Tax=Oculatella sp. LEGE 06141 TaxID=1828648 RepID=UPI001880B616|nr:MBOAT family protein [Oculatella sp. LEGE 06141]MBE9182865.1 MBOAT family protein [Oculatella sp. LEGE 06141]
MTFQSILYGLFLLSVLGIYWCVQERSLKLWIMLAASLVFYSSLQIQYVPLLLVISLVTYQIGMALNTPMDWHIADDDWEFAQQDWNRRRLTLLWLGIILNVLLLLGFKYVPFLFSSVGAIVNLPVAQNSANWIAARLLAPLGISFFSFECIAYLVDVYRGAPATYSFLKFAAYKLYFPKLISGPITRFHPFAAQLQTLQFPKSSQIIEGLWLIACGAVKKLLLADHLGRLVDLSFSNLERAGSGDLWLATFAYGLQLYLDFSGYVDVARGSAALMGIELPQNFYFPYFCTSIADFWRRWHMTLGEWLRNYLYFPLGGSRRGLIRTCLNLMLVMVIAGIWHGAAWGFIVWGAIHGTALMLHRLVDALGDRIPTLQTWWKSVPGTVLAWLVTQWMVFTSWIFFRLPDLRDSGLVVQRLWGHPADVQFGQKIYVETLQLGRPQITALLLALAAAMGIIYAFNRGLKLQLNWTVKILLVPICLFVAWLLAPNESSPYIYFDF